MTTITAIETARLVLYLLNNKDYYLVEHTSRLKLLKLLYYIQGYHLAMFDKPLFNDKIEAWIDGAVIPSVYKWMKNMTDIGIQDEEINKFAISDLKLHPQQIKLIKEVLYIYNKYSGYGLVDKICKETLYLDSYENGKTNEITQDSLKDYFLPLVESRF